MTASFDKAYNELLVIEGGLVDDPHDPGGRTNLGVTQSELDRFNAKHPELSLPAKVDDLTPDTAKSIYKIDYWDAVCGDALHPELASAMFKQCVNEGAGPVIISLQQALKVTADGHMGPITIAAANRIDPKGMVALFLTKCMERYILLDGWKYFGTGWTKRVIVTAIEAFT